MGRARWCDHLSSARVSVSERDGRSCTTVDLLPSVTSGSSPAHTRTAPPGCLQLGLSVCLLCAVCALHLLPASPSHHSTYHIYLLYKNFLYSMYLYLPAFSYVFKNETGFFLAIHWSVTASSLYNCLNTYTMQQGWSLNHIWPEYFIIFILIYTIFYLLGFIISSELVNNSRCKSLSHLHLHFL